MKIIFLISVCSFLYGNTIKNYIDLYTNDFSKLSDKQLKIIKKVYLKSKKYNLGFSSPAIAWEESNLGAFQININSNKTWDCGLFGNNTTTVLKRAKTKVSLWNKKLVCTKLITEVNYSFQHHKAEIDHWKKIYSKYKGKKGYWKKIWSGYNGGNKGNNDYANRINARGIVIARNLNKILKVGN